MKMQISKKFIAVLALLWSSVGMAGTIATVLVTSDNPTPAPGNSFTLTVHGDFFPEVAGATLGVTWDSAVVSLTGVALAPGSPFTSGVVADPPFNTPYLMSVLGPLVGTLPSGSFDAFVLNFDAIAVGAANIVLVDDQSDICWGDATTNLCVTPITYTQADVVVTGAAGPNIVVTDNDGVDPANPVQFGNVDLSVDATRTVTVTNSGTGDLNIANVTAPTGDFSLDNGCPGVVTGAGSCTITVHFIPTANGPAANQFDIVSDDADTPTVTVFLVGSGGLPDIVVTDNDGVDPANPVQFGDVQVSLNSSLDVTITNNGPGTLNLGTVTTPADTHFTLASNTCGATLTPAANCVVTVQFTPTATGVVNSSFDIPSDDPDTATVTVDLSGNGIPASAADIAVTDSDPSPDDHVMAFGDVQVGQASAPVTVTVTNNGGANLTVSGVTGLVAPFAVTGQTCTGAPIVPSATCTITVVFSPTVVGAAPDGTLTIASNDPDSPTIDVVASGTGTPIPAPDIAVTDSDAAPNDGALSFGDVLVGQTSPAITVTVTNTGDAILDITGAVAGANALPAPYSISNDTCSNNHTVAPAGTCTFEVQFAPTLTGPAPEAFDIPSNDADENPVIVTVNGNGLGPNIAVTDSVGAAGDNAVPFGGVRVGQTSAAATVTVTNSGTTALTVSGITGLAAPYSVTGETCTAAPIAATANCTITVVFAPTVVGAAPNDTLTIASDDPDTPTVDVVMSGTGTEPEISVATSIDFGGVAEGNTGTETLTVTNSGTGPLDIGAVTSPAAPFEITGDTCSGETIDAAGTCEITVEFTPDAIAPFDSSFDIPSNDADEPVVTVDVIGDGVVGGGLRSGDGGSSLDPATLLGLGLVGLAFKRRRRA